MGDVSAQEKITTGLSSELSWPVSQGPLTAAFTGTPVQGAAPLSVSFTDRSIGSPTSWTWSFGDGSISTERAPVHVYAVKGIYSVFLMVKNGHDTSSLLIPDYITVGTTPSLQTDFIVSPVNGMAPLTVKCTDKSICKPTMLVYNFGDGTNATGQNRVQTCKVPGNYTISLTITKYNPATGSVESSVATKTNAITVTNVPFVMPVAKFIASPTNGTVPLSVKFTDQSDGNPTMYNYDFGDGVNMTGPNPVHTYRFPGVYNVTLTVLKNDAANGSIVSNTLVQNGLVHVNGK